MSEQLYDALEACLELMEEGVSIERCLERYPNLADDLRPTLEAAYAAMSLANEGVPLEAMNRSRTRLLGKAARMRKERSPSRAWMGLPRLAFSLLILAVLLITTSGGLFAASAKSLPGDALYPVKRAVANFRVNMASGAEQKSEAETEFRLQRIGEVRQLLEMQLVRNISFEGVVEKISAEQWSISGIQVQVSQETVFIGSITEGVLVEVEGTTELEGYVSAQEIHLREFQMTGLVEKITRQEWMISGMPVKITSATQIGIGIAEGDSVLALVHSDDNNTLTAKAILSLGQPTATSTPQPTATPTSDLMDQSNKEAESTEADDAEDDADDSSGDEEDRKETKTPKPEDEDKDDSGSGDEEPTPEPEKTEDDHSGPGDGGPTDEPEETEEPESTPTPDEDADDDETPTPEQDGDDDDEATLQPEETDEP